jgi:ferrous iron transport protein A
MQIVFIYKRHVMKLADLKVGQQATIVSLDNIDSVDRKKLLVLGVLPNSKVTLQRVAPLGDPLQIQASTVSLAIRKTTAQKILVEVA